MALETHLPHNLDELVAGLLAQVLERRGLEAHVVLGLVHHDDGHCADGGGTPHTIALRVRDYSPLARLCGMRVQGEEVSMRGGAERDVTDGEADVTCGYLY